MSEQTFLAMVRGWPHDDCTTFAITPRVAHACKEGFYLHDERCRKCQAEALRERLMGAVREQHKQATLLEEASDVNKLGGELLGIIGQLRRDADALEAILGKATR